MQLHLLERTIRKGCDVQILTYDGGPMGEYKKDKIKWRDGTVWIRALTQHKNKNAGLVYNQNLFSDIQNSFLSSFAICSMNANN